MRCRLVTDRQTADLVISRQPNSRYKRNHTEHLNVLQSLLVLLSIEEVPTNTAMSSDHQVLHFNGQGHSD